MKKNGLFKPSRFQVVRMRRRLSMKEVCEISGISVAKLSRIVNCKQEPDDETVKKLAKALDWPADFFFGSEMDFPQIDGVSFRT